MRDVLFLAHRLPYPPDKGDKIRSWHFLQHLAGTHRVHLGCLLDDPDDRQHLPRLERLCASVRAIEIRPTRRRIDSLRGLIPGSPLTFPYFADRPTRGLGPRPGPTVLSISPSPIPPAWRR